MIHRLLTLKVVVLCITEQQHENPKLEAPSVSIANHQIQANLAIKKEVRKGRSQNTKKEHKGKEKRIRTYAGSSL